MPLLADAIDQFDENIIDGFINGMAKAVGNQNPHEESISTIAAKFDEQVIDGAVNGIADGVLRAGNAVRKIQTGKAQLYLALTLAGVLLLLAYLFYFATE